MAALRYSGWLLLISGLLLACTVGPLYLGWWDAAWPAAIGSAIAALLVFSVIVNTLFEVVAYIALYFDRDHYTLAHYKAGFGRAFYRESGRLDAMAVEAGLTPLSDFESPDPVDTHEAPIWHSPEAALPTIEHLLARLDPATPLYGHLEFLRDALNAAREKGAQFYFLLKTWPGYPNATVEALRQGDMSVLATEAKDSEPGKPDRDEK